MVVHYTQSPTFRKLTLLVFGVYALILLKLILFKRTPSYYKNHFFNNYSMGMVQANFKSANCVPFKTIMLFANSRLQTIDIVANLLGNIVGFIPLGILLPILFPYFTSAKRVILTGLALSFCLELIQLFTVLGNFDVDDLMLNTTGAAIGYLVFWLERTYMASRKP